VFCGKERHGKSQLIVMKKFNKFYDGYFEQFNFKDQENIYAGFYNNYM